MKLKLVLDKKKNVTYILLLFVGKGRKRIVLAIHIWKGDV